MPPVYHRLYEMASPPISGKRESPNLGRANSIYFLRFALCILEMDVRRIILKEILVSDSENESLS